MKALLQKLCGYNLIVTLIFAGLAAWILPSVRGIFFPPDEFGYWYNAAALLGYDWSGPGALNPYYAFGYSLLLLPLMAGIKDMTLLYRSAVALNIFLALLHGLLLYRLLQRLFPKADKKKLGLIGAAGAFYPSILVYMQYTMAEVLLNLLFLITVLCLLGYLEKGGIREAAALAFAGGAMYAVHMRSLGILAALCLTVGFRFLAEGKDKKERNRFRRSAPVFFILFILLFVLSEIFKQKLQLILYGSGGIASEIAGRNDYAGQLTKLGRLFTIRGVQDLAIGIIGKVFYLGNTTFGLFYFALLFLWGEIRRERPVRKLMAAFLMAASMLNLLAAAVGMMGSGRIDAIVYGRYSETAAPLLVCLGLPGMLREQKLWKKGAAFIACSGLAAGLVNLYVNARGMTEFLPDFSIGIAWAAGQNPETTGIITLYPYLAGTAGTLALLGILWLVRKGKAPFECAALTAAVFAGMAVSISLTNLRPHQADNLGDQQLAQSVLKLAQQGGREVYLLHSDWNEYADILQFYLPETKIHVVLEEDADLFSFGEEELIVTYRDDKRDKVLRLLYHTVERSYHLNLYYNR